MPCRSDYDDVPRTSQETERLRTSNEKLRSECDLLTKFLCTVLTDVYKCGNEAIRSAVNNNGELSKWWKAHQEFDRKRNEAARKKIPDILSAAKDLSPEDLEALIHKLKNG